jgi:FlaA1/EpsC-like NDP-sugar epimerase
MFDNSVVLITGGTGSFGKKYTQTVLERRTACGISSAMSVMAKDCDRR